MIFGESRGSGMFALLALIYTKIKELFIAKKKSPTKRLGKHHDM